MALQTALPNFINEKSKITRAEMTRVILSQCDDVVFSEESWKRLNPQQKGAVIGAFDMVGQQEYVGIDIFSGTEWTLIT